MLYLKSCPKCHGDVYLDRDGYGAFLTCIQCGRTSDLPDQASSMERAARLEVQKWLASRNGAVSASGNAAPANGNAAPANGCAVTPNGSAAPLKDAAHATTEAASGRTPAA